MPAEVRPVTPESFISSMQTSSRFLSLTQSFLRLFVRCRLGLASPLPTCEQIPTEH